MNADRKVQVDLVPLNGSPFTIDYADYLSEFFFRANASSFGPNAYDDCVLKGLDPSRITDDDISAVNQTMAARTPHKYWTDFTEATTDEPWLTALDLDWDLYAMPETEWLEHVVHKHLDAAFKAVIGPYRGPAVVTKVLHIKRPRLIPVCDSYVARTMGVELVDGSGLLRLNHAPAQAGAGQSGGAARNTGAAQRDRHRTHPGPHPRCAPVDARQRARRVCGLRAVDARDLRLSQGLSNRPRTHGRRSLRR